MITGFTNYFKQLGFSEKEAEIFITLYKLGNQPASVISKNTGYERTTVYKILLKLSNHNLVSITQKGNIKIFFIENPNVIKNLTQKRLDKYKNLSDNFPNIESELNQLKYEQNNTIPKIHLYDGIKGVENIFSDIAKIIEIKEYISIKFFSSNVIDNQNNGNKKLNKISEDFFKILKDKKVSVDAFLGNGIMVMEKISKSTNIEFLSDLPASNSGINIFIVGKVFYMILLKNSPFGIKIESDDLANSMHCLFDSLNN